MPVGLVSDVPMTPALGVEPLGLRNRVVSNTLVQLVSPIGRTMLGLVLTVTLSRYLGLAGFGGYALVFAYVAMFSGIFNDWGLGTICLREISQRPGERIRLISSAASLQGVISLATYMATITSLMFLRYPSNVVGGIGLYALTLLLAPLDILALPFQADLRLARLVAPSLLGVGLNFVLSITIVLVHGPFLALIGAALTSLILQYGWVSVLSLRTLRFAVRPTTSDWAPLVREAWPLAVGTIITTVLQQAPILALSLGSLESVGLFNAANRIPQQLLVLPLAIRGTSFPLLSLAWQTDRSRFARLLESLVGGSLLVSIPTAILGLGLAEPLMHGLFGAAFAGAATPFALLVGVFALLFPGILLGEALTAAGFQRLNLVILAASFPLLVTLLLILVPAGGASGAALALLCCYAAIVLATTFAAHRRIGFTLPRTRLGQGVLAIVLGAATLEICGRLGPILAATAAGSVAFVLVGAFQTALFRELWSLRPLRFGGNP